MIRLAAIIAGAVVLMLWFAMREKGAGRPPVPGAITVPSGQAISLIDTVQAVPGPQGLTARFRFLAPAIARDGGGVTPESAQTDMAFLCDTYALPRLPEPGPRPSQIIITLADRVVPFGEADPEATQFFEAFGIEGDTCIWEAF